MEREKYDGRGNELVFFLSHDTKNGGIKQGSVRMTECHDWRYALALFFFFTFKNELQF